MTVLTRCCTAVVVAFMAMLTAQPSVAQTAVQPLVQTRDGAVQGNEKSGYREFLGIPYAAAPDGPLRWRPPIPAAPWNGVRKAKTFGARCIQTPYPGAPVEGREDCLFLNIYSPGGISGRAGAGLPVLVWLHPGSLRVGSGQDLDGSEFAVRNQVVVVTVNYRLGLFGFLSLPELDREDARGTSGNYGLLDQQAALRWVRDNIRQFGGDAAKVTLGGQSAGSFSTSVHTVIPSSKGLFRGAISMSSPIVVTSAYNYQGNVTKQMEQREGASARFTRYAGCVDPAARLACLRGKSAEALSEVTRPWGALPFGVVVDGTVVPQNLSRLALSGSGSAVPVLNGSGDREAALAFVGRSPAWEATIGFFARTTPLSYDEYRDDLLGRPHGARILETFPIDRRIKAEELQVRAISSAGVCNILRTGDAFAQRAPVYEYLFIDPDAPLNPGVPTGTIRPGAYHTADLQYVFGRNYPSSFGGAPNFTPAQTALSRRMMADWGQFVREGRITSPGWSPLGTSKRVTILQPGVVTSAERRAVRKDFRCEFWDSTHANP